MTVPYTPPEFEKAAFNCPQCGAYSNQVWWFTRIIEHYGVGGGFTDVNDIRFAVCVHCSKYSLWRNSKMIYPSSGAAPLPNPDLPEEIKADYEEARSILTLSPRGAAALLRLAIQKLCRHLGETGKNLNKDIANLVKKGLPAKIRQSLDIVRVIGNNAAHPGRIDLKDDTETASRLFQLVNLIADEMISQPKQVDELYTRLPQSQREAIAKRDGTS